MTSISPHQSDQSLLPPEWPPREAVEWGADKYGLRYTFSFKGVKQRFRWLPPGGFMMGSPEDEEGRRDNEAQHRVRLTKGFWLANTTVTQELYEKVMGDNPSEFKGKDLPVETVNWDDIQEFISKLNQEVGEEYFRLPTEAEWEYACRAGTISPYSFGDEITSDLAHYDQPWDSRSTKPVKSYQPNQWGLYQMHGNVWEWCQDWYGKYDISQEVTIDPTGPTTDDYYRVVRGGSWFVNARFCRSAYRSWFEPGIRLVNLGFRPARVQF